MQHIKLYVSPLNLQISLDSKIEVLICMLNVNEYLLEQAFIWKYFPNQQLLLSLSTIFVR